MENERESGTKERESSVYYYINYSYTTLLNIRTIYLYYIILLKINKINFLHIKCCRLLQYHLHVLLILINVIEIYIINCQAKQK